MEPPTKRATPSKKRLKPTKSPTRYIEPTGQLTKSNKAIKTEKIAFKNHKIDPELCLMEKAMLKLANPSRKK